MIRELRNVGRAMMRLTNKVKSSVSTAGPADTSTVKQPAQPACSKPLQPSPSSILKQLAQLKRLAESFPSS
jgi:hypothetical protein